MINDALVVPVPSDRRPDGISRLELSSAIPLQPKDAVTILGLESNPSMALPQSRIESEIARLREQKRLELEERKGSWGKSFQDELDQLEILAKNGAVRQLKPVLARAVARSEYGHFYVAMCGSVLGVTNGSLGSGPMPPLIKTPVVVFLNRVPTAVAAEALQAQ